MMIAMIKSLASNIPMTKGTMYVFMRFDQKIFIEYVGTNMSIQVPLMVIDQK